MRREQALNSPSRRPPFCRQYTHVPAARHPRRGRRHRAPPAELRGPAAANRHGPRRRRRDRARRARHGRGRHRRRQVVRLSRAGDRGGVCRQGMPGRHLHAHDRPARATHPQGHPVSPAGYAATVPAVARQGARQLSQPAPAARCREACRRAPDRSGRPGAARRADAVGAAHHGRQPQRSGVSPARRGVGAGRERFGQLHGQALPQLRRLLLLQGAQAAAPGPRARRQPRAVFHRPDDPLARPRRHRHLAQVPRGRLRRGAQHRGRRRRPSWPVDHARPGGIPAQPHLPRAARRGPRTAVGLWRQCGDGPGGAHADGDRGILQHHPQLALAAGPQDQPGALRQRFAPRPPGRHRARSPFRRVRQARQLPREGRRRHQESRGTHRVRVGRAALPGPRRAASRRGSGNSFPRRSTGSTAPANAATS